MDADAAMKAEVAWRVESGVSLQLAFVVLVLCIVVMSAASIFSFRGACGGR